MSHDISYSAPLSQGPGSALSIIQPSAGLAPASLGTTEKIEQLIAGPPGLVIVKSKSNSTAKQHVKYCSSGSSSSNSYGLRRTALL